MSNPTYQIIAIYVKGQPTTYRIKKNGEYQGNYFTNYSDARRWCEKNAPDAIERVLENYSVIEGQYCWWK